MDLSWLSVGLYWAGKLLKLFWDVFGPFIMENLAEIVALVTGLIYTRDWQKVKKEAERLSWDYVSSELGEEEKLQGVASKLWDAVPKKVKILPFITPGVIRNVAKAAYVLKVKPELAARRETKADKLEQRIEQNPSLSFLNAVHPSSLEEGISEK